MQWAGSFVNMGMTMLRRNFLTMLGLGGAATAVGTSAPLVDPSEHWKAMQHTSMGMVWGRQDDEKHIEDIRRMLFDYDDIEAAIERTTTSILQDADKDDFRYLDPDIAAMKSFSGVAKMRLQARRWAERSVRNRKESLLSQLNNWLEKVEGKA